MKVSTLVWKARTGSTGCNGDTEDKVLIQGGGDDCCPEGSKVVVVLLPRLDSSGCTVNEASLG